MTHPMLTWWTIGLSATLFSWWFRRDKIVEVINETPIIYPVVLAGILILALSFDSFFWPIALTYWYWEEK